MKVVFLNGPPGAGKDTLGGHLKAKKYNDEPWQKHIFKFSESLKIATHALCAMTGYKESYVKNIEKTPYVQVYGPAWFNHRLYDPAPEFFGASPALIYETLYLAFAKSKLALPDLSADFRVAVHALFGLFSLSTEELPVNSDNEFYVGVIKADFFESSKDLQSHFFSDLSPREAYIEFSEAVVKPTFKDKQFFGKVLVNRLKQLNTDPTMQLTDNIIFITDSGFYDEAIPVIDYCEAQNCFQYRIHADKRGKSFVGDSRSYFVLPITNRDIENNTYNEISGFLNAGWNTINQWLQGKLSDD